MLPEGFQRIRYYGFLANRYRRKKLAHCRELLGCKRSTPDKFRKDYRERYQELTGSLTCCPHCQHGQMVILRSFRQHSAGYDSPRLVMMHRDWLTNRITLELAFPVDGSRVLNGSAKILANQSSFSNSSN